MPGVRQCADHPRLLGDQGAVPALTDAPGDEGERVRPAAGSSLNWLAIDRQQEAGGQSGE